MKMLPILRRALTLLACLALLTRMTHAGPALTQVIDILPGPDTFEPGPITIDESRDRLYVLGWNGNSSSTLSDLNRLSICEGNGLAIITGVDLGEHFNGASVAVDGTRNRAYVFGFRNNPFNANDPENGPKVKVIDGATKTVIQTIAITGVSGFGTIALNRVTNKLYGADGIGLFVVDLATEAVTNINAAAGSVVVNETTNRIYHLFSSVNRVVVIDGTTDTAGTEIDLSLPGTMFVDEARNKVYVVGVTSDGMGNDFHRIQVIAGATGPTPATLSGNFDIPFEQDYGFSFGLEPVFDGPASKLYLNSVNADAAKRATVVDVANAFQKIGTLDGMQKGTVLNATTQKMYFPGVAITGAHNVLQLDVGTGALAKLTTGAVVGNVVYDAASDKIWAVDAHDDQIYIIDAASGVVEASVREAGRGSTASFTYLAAARRGLALNPATNRLYVASLPPPFTGTAMSSVEVIDTTTRQKVASVPFPSPNLLELAVDPVTNRIYGGSSPSSGNAQNIVVIDGATHQTNTLSAIGVAMFVEPAANRLWTTNDSLAGVLDENNLATGTLVRSTGDVFTRPYGISVHRPSGKILVANSFINSVSLLRISDLNIDQSIQLAGTAVDFNRVHIVETNPTNKEGYALLDYDDDGQPQLEVLDLATNTVTSEIALPGRFSHGIPTATALNAQAREIYIADGGNGTISVVGGLSGPDDGGGGGDLRIAVSAATPSDPTGTTGLLGDMLTYTVSVRNAGTQTLNRVVVSSPIPTGTLVDANSVKQSGGKLVKKKSVQWSLRSLPPEATPRTFTFHVKIKDDPSLLGTLLANASTQVFARGFDAVTAATVTTQVGNPLQATISAFPSTGTHPGGIITYTLTVRNLSSLPARRVEAALPVPERTALLFGGANTCFLDGGGLLAPRIDFRTGREVVPPEVDPYNLHSVTVGGKKKLLNPGYPEDHRRVHWWFGDMGPNETQALRLSVRVRYDEPESGSIALPALELARNVDFRKPKKAIPGTVVGSIPNLPVGPPPSPVATPKVALYVRAFGAGEDIDASDGTPLTLVSTQARSVVGADPPRKTNQIRFVASYANSGDGPAESMRVFLLVPPGTVLDRKSVTIGDENGLRNIDKKALKVLTLPTGGTEVPEIDDALANGGFLTLEVPFLEGGFPGTIGSGKTVSYTVTLQDKPKRNAPSPGDRLGMFGLIRSEMFNGPLYLKAIALSNPLVTNVKVVDPVILTVEHSEAVLDSTTADNRLLRTKAFYRNTGGSDAEEVVAIVTIPPGTTFEAGTGALLDAGGNSVLGAPVEVNAGLGEVKLRLGSYAPGQKSRSLRPGQLLQIHAAFRTVNAAVPTSSDPTPRSSTVTPAFFLYHQDDRPPVAPLAGRGQKTRNDDGQRSGSQTEASAYVRKPSDPVFFYGVDAPGSASPGQEITFLIYGGNMSDNAGGATVVFPIPTETVPVSFSVFQPPGVSIPGVFRDPGVLPEYPNGFFQTSVGSGTDKHYCGGASVTVRVVENPTANEIVIGRAFLGAKNGGYIFLNPIKIPIVGATTAATARRDSIVRAGVGVGAANAFGRLDIFNPANIEFANDVKRLSDATRIRKISGAGLLNLKAGPVVIPLGDGQVAVIGPASIVAAGGGNVVANDGAGIVAAGGGNLIGLNGIVASLTQPNLYNLVATALKDQSGSLLPGASIVAGGGGNIVAGGGGNLIGLDGASLIGQDGAGLRAIIDNDSSTGAPVSIGGQAILVNSQFAFTPALVEKATLLGGRFAAGLFEQPGPEVITFGQDVIVQSAIGQLFSNQGAGVLANDGAGLIGQDGAGIVAAGAGNIVAGGGGNLLPK